MSSKTEILGFEDSWKKNRHVFGSTKSLAKVMYLDGQQSKQAEIDRIVGIITEAYKSGGNSSVETVYDKIQELLK